MSIPSPTDDPACDKKLWWRCVFIAAAVQLVMILLFFLFESRFFGKVLLVLYSPAGSIPRCLRRIRIENVFASGSFPSRVRSGVIP